MAKHGTWHWIDGRLITDQEYRERYCRKDRPTKRKPEQVGLDLEDHDGEDRERRVPTGTHETDRSGRGEG